MHHLQKYRTQSSEYTFHDADQNRYNIPVKEVGNLCRKAYDEGTPLNIVQRRVRDEPMRMFQFPTSLDQVEGDVAGVWKYDAERYQVAMKAFAVNPPYEFPPHIPHTHQCVPVKGYDHDHEAFLLWVPKEKKKRGRAFALDAKKRCATLLEFHKVGSRFKELDDLEGFLAFTRAGKSLTEERARAFWETGTPVPGPTLEAMAAEDAKEVKRAKGPRGPTIYTLHKVAKRLNPLTRPVGAILSALSPEALVTYEGNLGVGALDPDTEVTFSLMTTWAEEDDPLPDKAFILDCATRGDDGCARVAKKYLGKKYVFSGAVEGRDSSWWRFVSHGWERDSGRSVEFAAQALIEDRFSRAGYLEESSPASNLANIMNSAAGSSSVLKKMKIHFCEPGFEAQLDRKPFLFGVKNGIIDLTTGTLRDGQPDDMVSLFSPVEYLGVDTPCPAWDRFLTEVHVDAQGNTNWTNIKFLQEFWGYNLTGCTRDHFAVLHCGPTARNGKSVSCETIIKVMGPMADQLSLDVLMQGKEASAGSASPHLMPLKTLRSAHLQELSKGGSVSENNFKRITGADTLTGRQLYTQQTSFQSVSKINLWSNHKPLIDADDNGVWDRICAILYRVRFYSPGESNVPPNSPLHRPRDDKLPEKLSLEHPGILAWLVRGCLRWQKEGLVIPQSVRDETARYREEMDTLKDFFDQCCEIGKHHSVGARAFFECYTKWCIESNINARYRLTRRSFPQRLLARGYTQEKHGDGNYWVGITTKD